MEHFSNTEYLGHTQQGRSLGGTERLEHYSTTKSLGYSVNDSGKMHHYGSGGISFRGTQTTRDALDESSKKSDTGSSSGSRSSDGSSLNSGSGGGYGNSDSISEGYGSGFDGVSSGLSTKEGSGLGSVVLVIIVIGFLSWWVRGCFKGFDHSAYQRRNVAYQGATSSLGASTTHQSLVQKPVVKAPIQKIPEISIRPKVNYWTNINEMKSTIDRQPIGNYNRPHLSGPAVYKTSTATTNRSGTTSTDYLTAIAKMKADLDAQSIELSDIRNQVRANIARIDGSD